MISKIFVLACLLATTVAFRPNCKIETEDVESQYCYIKPTEVCEAEADGEIVFQTIAPDEPVCIDVVETLCVPAKVAEEGCEERTRKKCVPSDKIVDHAQKVPERYADEKFCIMVPKGMCETKTHNVPKMVCEPVEAKHAFYGYWPYY